MIDLTKIPAETMKARGEYSTVRAAHEDEKKRLSILCGQLQTSASQVLRRLQPDNDDIPDSIESLMSEARQTLDAIENAAQQIESLARQRADLKPLAWPRH